MQYVLKKTVFQRRTSFFVKTQLQMLLSDFIMKGIMRMRSVRCFLDIWMIQYAIALIMILKIVKKMMMIIMLMDMLLSKREVSDHQGTRKLSTKKHLVTYYVNYKVKWETCLGHLSTKYKKSLKQSNLQIIFQL